MISELSNLFGKCREAVLAIKDGEIRYNNDAALRLFDNLSSAKPADILPEQVLDGNNGNYSGETAVGGDRAFVSASTIGGYRVCILHTLPAENSDETVRILTAAGCELRNMLSVLKMAYGLLLPCVENPGNQRPDLYTAIMNHCFYRMLRLTNNISDLGEIMQGNFSASRSSYDIVASCRELAGAADHLVSGAGAQVLFESNEELLVVCADKLRIEKMLLNLISNSLLNSPKDAKVTISVVSAADRVVLSVSDDGPGIGGGIMPALWSRYRTDKELTERTSGLGLGLTIVQNTARLHGGSALLESKPGGGTTVTVALPLHRPAVSDSGTTVPDDGGYGMQQLLTELSGVVGHEKYTQLYMD